MMTSISHLARVKQGTAALVLGAILAAAGCRGDTVSPPPPAPPIIARVEVTASRTTLGTGDTLRATAAALDSTGKAVSGATFSWSTDDVSLATVDTGGLVHALRAGSVHVQATATGPAESLKSVVTGQVAF